MQPILFRLRVDPDGTPYPELGKAYLTALKAAGLPVRALSMYPTSDLQHSEWDTLRDMFVTPFDSSGDYINIVCGFGEDFGNYRVKGKENIAITGLLPRLPNDAEQRALGSYHLTVTPTLTECVALEHLKFGHVRSIPPDPAALVMAFSDKQLRYGIFDVMQ